MLTGTLTRCSDFDARERLSWYMHKDAYCAFLVDQRIVNYCKLGIGTEKLGGITRWWAKIRPEEVVVSGGGGL